jgi:hypothetical protein
VKYYKDENGSVFAYEADGSQDEFISENLTPITESEANALRGIDPDAVPVKTQFTSLEFLDRFTDAEQLAVVAATMQSAPVKLWYDRLLAASYVDLSDPRTEAGIDALILGGLVSASRKAALMKPEPI